MRTRSALLLLFRVVGFVVLLYPALCERLHWGRSRGVTSAKPVNGLRWQPK